jgi:hypothetical protein
MNSVYSSSDYVAYLYIHESETTLHQKIMLIADRSRLRRETVETSHKNEICQLYLMALKRAWITIVSSGLSFSNCVAVLALDFDTPVS